MKNLRLSGLQSGATAIEFAFVFPALFMLSYAGLFYGYVFYLQQSLNFAAEESARFALAAVPPGVGAGASGAYCGALSTSATLSFAAYQGRLANGGGKHFNSASLTPFCEMLGGVPTFRVQLQLPTAALIGTAGGFAQFVLPGIGTFPPIQPTLSANAVIAIN